MSSEVMTHPTWKRLHVALLVSDMVKSMIRLSRLGRSIFPINWPPGRERRNPALALRFRSMAGADSHVAKYYPRLTPMVWQDERKGCRLFIGLHRSELVIGDPRPGGGTGRGPHAIPRGRFRENEFRGAEER